MNLISHGGITKKINGYLARENSERIELTSSEKENVFANINLMFSNSLETPGYLENFRMEIANNKNIYSYDIVSVDKQKKTEYIAISEQGRPLLLMSHSKNDNDNIKYVEESFTTYEEETKRIASRIKSNLMIIGNSAVLNLNILDKKKNDYYKQEYEFYYDINKIVAYQIGKDKFFNDNDYRLIYATKKVDEISNKIEKHIDEYLEINLDYVKEYHIKRKTK